MSTKGPSETDFKYDQSKSTPQARLMLNIGKLAGTASDRLPVLGTIDQTGISFGFDDDNIKNGFVKKLKQSGIEVTEESVQGLPGVKIDAIQAQKFFKDLLKMPTNEFEEIAKPFPKLSQQQPQVKQSTVPLRKFPQKPPPPLPKKEAQKLKDAYIQKIIDELKKLPSKMGAEKQLNMGPSIENIQKALEKCPTVFNVLEHATEYLMQMVSQEKVTDEDKRALFKASSDIIDIDVQPYLPKPPTITPPTIVTTSTTTPPEVPPQGQRYGDFTKGKAPATTTDENRASYILGLTIPEFRSSPGHNYFTLTSTIFNEAGKITDKSRIVSPMFLAGGYSDNDFEKRLQPQRDVASFAQYFKAHLDEAKAGTPPVPRRLLVPLGLPGHECGLVVDIDGAGKSKVLFFDPMGSPSGYKSRAEPFIQAIRTQSSSTEEFESQTKYQHLSKGDFNCGTWTLWYLLEKASKDVPLSELAKSTVPTEDKKFIEGKRIGYIEGLHTTLEKMDPRAAYIADLSTKLRKELPEFQNKERQISIFIENLLSKPELGVKANINNFLLNQLPQINELKDKKSVLERIATSIRNDGVDESKFTAPTGPSVQPLPRVPVPRVTTPPLSSEIANKLYFAIVNNKPDELKELLNSLNVDPNLAFMPHESLLNVAKNLGAKDCYNVLVKYGADEKYAKQLELVKQFGHVIKMGGKVDVDVKFKGGTASVQITPELSTSLASLNWVQRRFNKYSESGSVFKDLADSFQYTINNYAKITSLEMADFAEKIQKQNTITCIPSGYQDHNVGIIFYKDKMIVCDGSDKIQIHTIDPKEAEKIKALAKIGTKEEYEKALKDISKGFEVIDSKAQKVNNCTYENFIGAAQGLMYLKAKEKSEPDPEGKAETDRKSFDSKSKDDMAKEVRDLIGASPEDKALGMQLLNEYIKKCQAKGPDFSENVIRRLNIMFEKLPDNEIKAFCEQHHLEVEKFKKTSTSKSGEDESAQIICVLKVDNENVAKEIKEFLEKNRIEFELKKSGSSYDFKLSDATYQGIKSDPALFGELKKIYGKDDIVILDQKQQTAKSKSEGDALDVLFEQTHGFTPQQHANPPQREVARTDPSVTLSEFAAAVNNNQFKDEHKFIKNIDVKPDKVTMDIACTDGANPKTNKCYVEKAGPQGGVKVSMDKIDNPAERLKALENICKATVDALKPGQEVKIPPTHPQKDAIEKFVNDALKERCQKMGVDFKQGEFKIPVPTPQQKVQRPQTH